MLNRSASLAMSTYVLKALPGKLDIKRLSPSILYFLHNCGKVTRLLQTIYIKVCLKDKNKLINLPGYFYVSHHLLIGECRYFVK